MSGRAFTIGERRDAFGAFVGLSLLLHAAAVAVLVLSPNPAPRASRLPAVIQVNLLATAPAPRARPAPPPPKAEAPPKPAPAPPPPPPPEPKKVALPTEPTRPPEPKAAAEPKPRPKPKPTPPEPVPEKSYEDVMASLRQEAGEPRPETAESVAPEPPPEAAGPSGGVGVRISVEEAAWRKRAKLHVHRAWVLAPGFRRQALETEVRVKLGPGGHVTNLRVLRSSGNPWYDESVERAIRKASPLPAPPQPGEWIFLFRPEDLFG